MQKIIGSRTFLFHILMVTVLSLFISFSVQAEEKAISGQKPDLETTEQLTTITIGRVSDNPKEHYPRLKAFIDYLASHLKQLGIEQGDVLLAKDNQQMVEYLKTGKVDLIMETPFSAFVYFNLTGARPLLRRWKKGVAEYHSIIFVRKDSGIDSVGDLKGKIICFEDRGSTSGYFLPKASLTQQGLELVELKFDDRVPEERIWLELVKLKSAGNKISKDKAGYIFAGGEKNIATWVHRGLADAGALSNLEFELEDVPQEYKKDFKVIFDSIAVPRCMVMVRKEIIPELEKEIKNILLGMLQHDHSRELMENLADTKKFDEFPEGKDKAFDQIRELFRFVADDVN